MAALGPEMRHWWINACIALPLALLTGVLSWHFIEKPALGQRRRIPAIKAGLMKLAMELGSLAGPLGTLGRGTVLPAALKAVAGAGGLIGPILLVNGTVPLGCILGSFAAALLGATLRHAGAEATRTGQTAAQPSGI